jgi:hypothetical protein
MGKRHWAKLAAPDRYKAIPAIVKSDQFVLDVDSRAIITKPVPNDWEDFVKLCTIRSGNSMLRFNPYSYQVLLSKLMDDFNNIVVVKSRQLGTTQGVASKFLHRACLNPAYSSMAFMRNADDAGALSRRARQMLEGIKEYVTPSNDNVGHLKLKGLGEIYFRNSSKEGSRSYDSVSDFLFDEAAFVEKIDQIYSASSPSGALSGDTITKMIVSTPSAKSGWYWSKLTENNGDKDVEELCKAVARGEIYRDIPGVFWWVDEIGTVKLILHWKCHPIYSQREDYLEYRARQDGTDMETVLREYNLEFIDSSVSIFLSDTIRAAAIGKWEDDRCIGCDYFIGIDTSTIGLDYCVAIVLKRSGRQLSVVAMYRKRQQTSDYHLYQIGELIERYKPAVIGIETTGGVGQLYLEQIAKQYPGIEIVGIRTGGDTKPVLISGLQLKLDKNDLDIPSESIISSELLNFRRQGRKLEASNGHNDDTVMALAFATFVADKFEGGWNLGDIPVDDMDLTLGDGSNYLHDSHTDLLVKVSNPQILDQTVQYFGAVVLQDISGNYIVIKNGCYVVRCYSNNRDFVKFAITQQGYGDILD